MWTTRIVITWAHPDPLRWRHDGRDSVSNHQPHDCLLNRLFRRRWKKTSKFRVTGLCAGNSPGTCEFPAQMASNAENVSIWWRHHATAVDNLIGSLYKGLLATNLLAQQNNIICLIYQQYFSVNNYFESRITKPAVIRLSSDTNICYKGHITHILQTQNVINTNLNVKTTFWRNNYVFITMCVCWAVIVVVIILVSCLVTFLLFIWRSDKFHLRARFSN